MTYNLYTVCIITDIICIPSASAGYHLRHHKHKLYTACVRNIDCGIKNTVYVIWLTVCVLTGTQSVPSQTYSVMLCQYLFYNGCIKSNNVFSLFLPYYNFSVLTFCCWYKICLLFHHFNLDCFVFYNFPFLFWYLCFLR